MPLRLSEEAAREVLLVRSLETEDSAAVVLTRDDRQYATDAAASEARLGEAPDRRQIALFLTRRADLALTRLIARYPTIRRACGFSRWPRWLNWAVPVGALGAGLATNEIQGGRLNVLAFPLLGLIVWNLAIYVLLLFEALLHVLVPKQRHGEHPIVTLLERLGRPVDVQLAAQPTLERGVRRFIADWIKVAGPLTRHRASRTLHLGAAVFALGILASMLFRARYTAEYSAGWSGTWAGAEDEIAWVLDFVLGPASWLTGIAVPSVARLRELRGGQENAGDWLVLWSLTAVLFVIVPRLLLSAWNTSRAFVLKNRLAIRGADDFYVRTLVRNAVGRSQDVQVVAYSLALTADAREHIASLLRQTLGDKTKVEIDSVEYGAEDEWLARETDAMSGADQIVILFNLASTPEAENHGALAKGLDERSKSGGAALTVILDDTAFRHKLRGDGPLQRRLADRVKAWRAVLAPVGLEPVTISLGSADQIGSARSLEQAMLRKPVSA